MNWSERFFDAFMLPLEVLALTRRRRHLIRRAKGTVLEIGSGTGANLRHYNLSAIDELHLTDLSITESVRSGAVAQLTAGTPAGSVAVLFHEADAQDLPFADDFFDTVVVTLVFCSVPDPVKGLSEVRRVLKPKGRLLFMEHVKPERGMLSRAVDILNPTWRAINGDCNINRDTVGFIRGSGFRIEELRCGGRGLLVDGIARSEQKKCKNLRRCC